MIISQRVLGAGVGGVVGGVGQVVEGGGGSVDEAWTRRERKEAFCFLSLSSSLSQERDPRRKAPPRRRRSIAEGTRLEKSTSKSVEKRQNELQYLHPAVAFLADLLRSKSSEKLSIELW